MTRCGQVAALVVAACALGSPAAGQFHGYEALSDWAGVCQAKTGWAGLVSSYDRSGANNDWNYYESPEGHLNSPEDHNIDTVVTTLTGPGVITRFWMPHAAANRSFPIKITVDGVLRIDTNSNTLLDGGYGYMSAPLVTTLVGGQVSYEPIIFQDSLKIESKNYTAGDWARTHHYYQYTHHALTPSTVVTAYTGTLTGAQQVARDAAANMIAPENLGTNPAGHSPSAVELSQGPGDIGAGATLILADVTGAGRVRRLNLAMPGAADADLDQLRLRVRYDGSAQCAIDVPVSHFFGAGHGRAAYKSLPLGTDGEEGFYCYWPMPYRRSVTVELHNPSGAAIGIGSAVVEYEPGEVSYEQGYLHAAYDEETTTAGQAHHELLSARGRGHYVGNMLYLRREGTNRNILEGDDIILVGGREPILGTGLEDAYNGGYYYNHVLEQSDDGDVVDPESGVAAYHGLLNMDSADNGSDFLRTDQYRWLIADPVPFDDGIQVLIENFGDQAGVLFGSTAFYYALELPGDLDGDGFVGGEDLNIVLTNWGAEATAGDWLGGDPSGDGFVGGEDLNIVLTNWGQGELPSRPIPEPAAMALLSVGAVMLPRRRAPGTTPP